MADETNRTPDETLRAAAQRLRQVADAATPGPWAPMWEEADGWWTVTGAAHGKMICPEVLATDSKDDAAYIATMHPGVALALAAWLDAEADGLDLMRTVKKVTVALDALMRVEHSTWNEALAVARVVLGET